MPRMHDVGGAGALCAVGLVVVAEPDRIFLATVKTGDCLGEEFTKVVSDVLVVPCSEEHVYEVYGEFSLPEGDYPGEDAVTEDADNRCLDLFTDFVGLPLRRVRPCDDTRPPGRGLVGRRPPCHPA